MSILNFVSFVAVRAPFVAIAILLLRSALRRRSRKSRNPRLASAIVAVGAALQQFLLFFRPSTIHVIKVQQQADADEDDAGDPDSASANLNRQLRRIRRGEPIKNLVVRK